MTVPTLDENREIGLPSDEGPGSVEINERTLDVLLSASDVEYLEGPYHSVPIYGHE